MLAAGQRREVAEAEIKKKSILFCELL